MPGLSCVTDGMLDGIMEVMLLRVSFHSPLENYSDTEPSHHMLVILRRALVSREFLSMHRACLKY